ncbi:hypothetical protein K523DRAFT_382784, partial [Schizophyllum commune Tattone D]
MDPATHPRSSASYAISSSSRAVVLFGIIMHNEMKLESLTRIVPNALACWNYFDIGAMSVSRGGPCCRHTYLGPLLVAPPRSTRAHNAHILTFLIVIMTVQAQDRDEEGDRIAARGRHAIPIPIPRSGCSASFLTMLLCPIYVAMRCELSALLTSAFLAGGGLRSRVKVLPLEGCRLR